MSPDERRFRFLTGTFKWSGEEKATGFNWMVANDRTIAQAILNDQQRLFDEHGSAG